MSDRYALDHAVGKLRLWQPRAQNIRRTLCHCEKHEIMLSYTTPELEADERLAKTGQEACGYYCAACEWSNAGARDAHL